MTYEPDPINTTAVELEPGIARLTEQLARNTHDLWAQRRIADGWTHGSYRDDHMKKHPGLVPYQELPESEREYDRRTAIGALKAITALGYRIEPAPRLTTVSSSRSFQARLANEIAEHSRKDNFDMNDDREAAMAECHPRLADALRWLAGNVGKEWIAADSEANRSQRRHRRLAQTAILAGTAAIVFAILQLAAHLTVPSVKGAAGVLEAVAVAAALLAVGVGVMARMNRRWLGHRHRAERLRMLKFSALDRLWSDDETAWKDWVDAELRTIPDAGSFHLSEEWAEHADLEQDEEKPIRFHDGEFAQALIDYCRVKRLAWQRRYFENRYTTYSNETRPWAHVSLWFFFASIVSVLIHFGLEWGAYRVAAEWKHRLEDAAVWFVAMAAIIPVGGAGIRAWFSAFELTRSASLYKEKLGEIDRATEKLDRHANDVTAIRADMRSVERFLRREHREWLRLLRDAEWFL